MWLGLVAGPVGGAVSTEVESYAWRVALGGGHETGRVHRALLHADFFDGCQSFPLDVKVMDEQGLVWPSLIWMRPERGAIEPVRARPVGRTDATNRVGFTVKEFRIEPRRRDQVIPLHNRVTVQIGGGDFARRIEVWGGAGPDELVLLGAGMLVERKEPVVLRNRSVDYPDSAAAMVVVRVFDDAGQPGAPLDWRATDVMRVVRDEGDTEPVELDRLPRPDEEAAREGVLSLYFDAGARHRPLLHLDLDIGSRDFAFPVRIFGRQEMTNDWRWVADGSIHDMPDWRQTRIGLAKMDTRYLRVDVMHGAGPAPKIRGATAAAVPHFLVFTPLSEGRAHAYFGSERYQLPGADFSRRVSLAAIDEAPEVEMGRRQTNPARIAGSLDDYGRTLLRFGGGVVLLLIALVSIRVARHRYFK